MVYYVLGALLLYFLYRFIAGFVWPVYKAASAAKKQFDQMRSHMQQNHMHQENAGPRNGPVQDAPKFDMGGEYIPFEEVKER